MLDVSCNRSFFGVAYTSSLQTSDKGTPGSTMTNFGKQPELICRYVQDTSPAVNHVVVSF